VADRRLAGGFRHTPLRSIAGARALSFGFGLGFRAPRLLEGNMLSLNRLRRWRS